MNPRSLLIFPLAIIARVLAPLLLAGFAATEASAQGTTINAQTPPVITTPFPNPFQPPANLPSLGSADDWNKSVYVLMPSVPPRPKGPFFLPALLPVLGAAAPARAMPLARNYPREFAGEPFFMAYGNLLANHELSDKRADHLVSYRTARLTMLTELHAELDRTQGMPPMAREHTLAELAAAQTPRLLELEAEAEQIRHDLTRVELFNTAADDIGKLVPGSDDFTYLGLSFIPVPYRLGRTLTSRKDPRFTAALTSLRQILSAAQSQDGYSPDQRRLLEEMAQEIVLTIEPEAGPAAVFFWPAGVRIHEPAGLATKAAAQFEEFQRRKAALKNELRAALARENARVFNIDETEAREQLAAHQAARFAELDTLADQIRPALAALADTGDTLAVDFPGELARQITYLADRKAALQRELYDQLQEFRAKLPADRIELTREGSGLAITVLTNNGTSRDREAVLARITAFNADIAERSTALATVRDRVRDGLARYQASALGAKPGVTVDQVAADFLAAYNAREYRNQQRDYAAAVLASGLSPAQRRLLLAAATVDSLQGAAVAALSAP